MDTSQQQPATAASAGAWPEGIARATLDALSSRLCVVDTNLQQVASNRAWREFLPATPCRCLTAGADGSAGGTRSWVMPCWSGATAQLVDQAIEALRSGARDSFALEYECSSCVPSRWYLLQIKPLPGDRPGCLVFTHDDISERKLAERAQHLAAVRLKQLGAHLESVREEQSAAIARELHDELGAVMTMLKLDLATTAKQETTSAELRSKFDSLLEQVSAALQVIKRISTNLRPATLDTLGLMATIRWYVERFSQSTGIATQLELPEYVRLSDISSIAMFRILQEGLTNVAAHSGASKVLIRVEKNDGDLIMEIIDNGRGISAEQQQKPGSFGLIGMSERALYLGGHFSIDSSAATGTRLQLCIPLDN
ncbi:ATP-binding protein [Pseudomonas sp. N040]|uniref:ATP-binding protein n=1 Tax=Pseudomonas sp. N040 TaxID=2785325 RepID=UPI0018A313CD|nr:ATP-binding protein [Pseudomonas sp. N040]MBF7731670.1 hypothetical protein [Pseudomonas sp. N040]MBW7015314.1 hypothetical protein [Pseudomonas sp. N040]